MVEVLKKHGAEFEEPSAPPYEDDESHPIPNKGTLLVQADDLLGKAIDNNDEAQVRSLLENGYSVHGVDSQGRTLLHRAASTQNISSMIMLLQKGVNCSWTDLKGRTAFEYLPDDIRSIMEEIMRPRKP